MTDSGKVSVWASFAGTSHSRQQASTAPRRQDLNTARNEQPGEASHQRPTVTSNAVQHQQIMASYQLSASATNQSAAARASRVDHNTCSVRNAHSAQQPMTLRQPSAAPGVDGNTRLLGSANSAQTQDHHRQIGPAGVKKRRQDNNPPEDAPKRVANAFIRFRRSYTPFLQAGNPGMSMSEISIASAYQWNNMTDQQKKPYRDEYEEAQRLEHARYAAQNWDA
ncbi:hypothetical protein F5Y18DRAFT_434581 [Xylariaceae sp. FL1019]|nr:hypothetical protein F5Y18DRAFT_434581 [Xylariaceae sp. FL1019]